MAEYITSEEMDAYVADRPGSSAWTDATEAEQEDALKYSSKLVDSLPFVGKKYETDISSQPLQWPRLIKTRQGWVVADRDADDNVVVPQAIKDAVCEEILARLSPTGDERRALQASGVKSFRISDLSETFDSAMQGGGIKGTPLISWTAYRLLEPYLAKGARAR
jgi:hypothetical protein